MMDVIDRVSMDRSDRGEIGSGKPVVLLRSRDGGDGAPVMHADPGNPAIARFLADSRAYLGLDSGGRMNQCRAVREAQAA